MLDGAKFLPPSHWPYPAKCFNAETTLSSPINSPPPCRPATAASPIRVTRWTSSPKVSSIRPHRGSRARSSTGVFIRWFPRDRASRAAVEKTLPTSPGSQVDARAIACGNEVALWAIRPWQASPASRTGIPSRVLFSACRWMALANSADSRASCGRLTNWIEPRPCSSGCLSSSPMSPGALPFSAVCA